MADVVVVDGHTTRIGALVVRLPTAAWTVGAGAATAILWQYRGGA